jgi:hypothetical protein
VGGKQVFGYTDWTDNGKHIHVAPDLEELLLLLLLLIAELPFPLDFTEAAEAEEDALMAMLTDAADTPVSYRAIASCGLCAVEPGGLLESLLFCFSPV